MLNYIIGVFLFDVNVLHKKYFDEQRKENQPDTTLQNIELQTVG